MRLTLQEWADAAGGKILSGDPGMFIGGDGPGGLSIDSRTLSEGEWFIALKGKSGVDGHRFLEAAICRGAAGLIISNHMEYELKAGNSYPDLPALLVKDTTEALADAARALLDKLKPFVIAITGTVGKTSVKEAVAHITSKKWPTLKSIHNWNTEIGLPLTVFNLTPEHKVIVLECASRGIGQIHHLSMIARPDIAVITFIGAGHLSEFGSVEDVAKAKWEIIDGLKPGGVALVSKDTLSRAPQIEKNTSLITFGIEKESDYSAAGIVRKTDRSEFEISMPDHDSVDVEIPLVSRADVMNALAAFAIASYISVDNEKPENNDIVESLKTLPVIPGRMETIIRDSGIEVIFDGYNSNPASLKNAIDSWARRTSLNSGERVKRHVAILGDMLELGKDEVRYHRDAGKHLKELNLKDWLLITVGPLAENIGKAADCLNGKHYETTDDCAVELKNILKPGDLVLIKASRSLTFEKLLGEDW